MVKDKVLKVTATLAIRILEDVSARRLETQVNEFCLANDVKDLKINREPGKYIALIQYYK